MNERIKQLALQTKLRPALLLHHWGKIDALTDSEQEELEQLEKFAQLIVQECARVYCNIDDGEIYVEYVNALKKHFGVER